MVGEKIKERKPESAPACQGIRYYKMKDQLFEISGKFLGGKKEIRTATGLGNKNNRLEKYRQLMEQGEYMQISFEKVNGDGTLSRVEDGVVICMAPQEINGEAYDLRYKSQKLADIYYVRVVEVDEAADTVWVSHNEARKDKRPEIEAEINKRLSAKKKQAIRVKGKVIRIQTKMVKGESVDTGVWLDLCGVGILGFVYIGDWAQTFTPALKGTVAYGDVVEVRVNEKKVKKQKRGDVVYYACSRKELAENPWEQMELEEKYHVGDIVRIKCLSLKKGHWFGEINGLKDIQVFTEYPSAARNFPIIAGMEYMGKIYYMNTKERSLKARVFQALTLEGYEKEESREEQG